MAQPVNHYQGMIQLNRCRNCGAHIDDSQALNFDGLCPACMRDQKAKVRQKDDKTFESGIWLIVTLAGILDVVGTMMVAFILTSFASPFGELVFAPFMPVFVVSFAFGVGIAIIGYMMYQKTTEQQR